jgi:hypothetical protein
MGGAVKGIGSMALDGADLALVALPDQRQRKIGHLCVYGWH